MDINASFAYLNKIIQVQCKDDEDINKMYQKFATKLNDGSEAAHYIYYYDGNKLGHDSTIGKNKYLKGKKDLNIEVQKKLRLVKCPKCKCNDCIVDLSNYLLSFYGCKYNHSESVVYDDYINTQKIDSSELRCSVPDCPHNQQNYPLGFYKCLKCSKLVKRSNYCCKDHLEDHSKHITVKYDKKNYYCVKHSKPYTKYCFTHKIDLCEDCAKDHEADEIKDYDLMIPNLDKINKSLNDMEEKINDLKTVIEDIKSRLDGALRVFKRYHYIAKDIVGKFELFNKELKNYRILKSLRNLEFSNDRMNKDINKIIDEDYEIKKLNFIIKIFEEKEQNYRKNNAGEKTDHSKDNDDDWLEDAKKKEKNKNTGQKPQSKLKASKKK